MPKISRFILLALLALVAVSARAQRTDLNPAPETVPALCSPAPCTLTSSDLNPNVLYARVTDGTTDTFHAPGTSDWGTPDSIDHIWAHDNSTFYLQGFPLGDTIFKLNASTHIATVMPCSFAGTGCVNGMFVPGQFFNTADNSYSWTTPSLLYGFIGNVLNKLDFSATLATPSTAPVPAALADMSGCPGIAANGGPGGYSSIVSVNSTDTRFASMTGGTQDGTAHLIYVYDKSNGCRFLESGTMTIGGQWGTTGAVVWHDANGNVVAAPTFANLHGAQMTIDGRWIIFSSNANAPYTSDNFAWDVATNNVYDQQINGCWLGDHQAYGYDNKDVMTGGNAGLLFQTAIPNFGATQCANLTPTQPAGYPYSVAEHMSWKNARPGQSLPVSLSPFKSDHTAPTIAWQDELDDAATDGSGTVNRRAHMYTRATSYNAQGLQQISDDGAWILWCSDWNASGRFDVFLIQDPGGAAAGSPPAAPTSLTAVPQ